MIVFRIVYFTSKNTSLLLTKNLNLIKTFYFKKFCLEEYLFENQCSLQIFCTKGLNNKNKIQSNKYSSSLYLVLFKVKLILYRYILLCIKNNPCLSLFSSTMNMFLTILHRRIGSSYASLLWSLFGVVPLRGLSSQADNDLFIDVIGQALLASYMIMAITVMVNMLIAMMSRSFQIVEVNNKRRCLIETFELSFFPSIFVDL